MLYNSTNTLRICQKLCVLLQVNVLTFFSTFKKETMGFLKIGYVSKTCYKVNKKKTQTVLKLVPVSSVTTR